MNEYILVDFVEVREILIDDVACGYKTGDVVEIEPGTHTLSLKGQRNYTPPQQDVTPSNTSPLHPLVIHFSRA